MHSPQATGNTPLASLLLPAGIGGGSNGEGNSRKDDLLNHCVDTTAATATTPSAMATPNLCIIQVPLLSRPEHIVYFFRDVHGVGAITKDVLRKRTDDYNGWVESFAHNHNIPIEWAEKGVRKEDYTRPALRRMERQKRFGVYFILKSYGNRQQLSLGQAAVSQRRS